jgi:hypothetical protein
MNPVITNAVDPDPYPHHFFLLDPDRGVEIALYFWKKILTIVKMAFFLLKRKICH